MAELTVFAPPPDHARQISKSMMRKPTIDRLLASRESDIQHFVNFITKESIQKSIGMYLEMLKKRKAWRRREGRNTQQARVQEQELCDELKTQLAFGC